MAAKNYTASINSQTSATYMKDPVRFIKNELYEDFLEGDKGRKILTRYGFVIPGTGVNKP